MLIIYLVFFAISVVNSTTINSAFTTTTGGWTIEEIVWTNSCVYPEADAGTSCGTAYRTDTVGFDWNHAQLVTKFRFTQSCGNNTTVDAASINTSPYNTYNSWRYRTMIWNRGLDTNSLFINGNIVGSISTPNTSGQVIYAGNNLSIGTLYGWKHYGRRSVFKVYNRVLSDTEVRQNYNALKSRYL